MLDGHWYAVNRCDPRAYALYARHYSAAKNAPYRQAGNTNVAGSGSTMVLLTLDCKALFVWLRNSVERLDHQAGISCSVFRNEGAVLSSELIREADAMADVRWPGERHFTYVDAGQVRPKRDPGRCFIRAGWRVCGQSQRGLILLERAVAVRADGRALVGAGA